MKKNNGGFTLIEMIVTVVVSGITLLMLAFLISNVANSWNKIKAKNERSQSQTIIEKCFESAKDYINQNDLTAYIDTSKVVISDNSTYVDSILFITSGGGDLIIVYKGDHHQLERVDDIEIVKMTDNSLLLEITFDDDSIIEKKYSFKNEIVWR